MAKAAPTPEEGFDAPPVGQLLSRFKEAKQARLKYDKNWTRNWELVVTGNHWKGISNILWFQSNPVYDKSFEFVEIMRAMLSDQKWGIDALPQFMKGEGGVDPAEMAVKANNVLDFLWEDCHLQSKNAQNLLHVFTKGTGLTKGVFDPSDVDDTGIGQINVSVVDPFYIFPDPDATCVEDAAFIFEAKPVSLRYIARRWPDKIAAVVKDGGGSTLEMRPRGDQGVGAADPGEGKRVDIYECWYHDATVTVLEDLGDDMKIGAKYPNGRYTIMTSTGVVLEDKANPYTHFPYYRTVEIPVPGEFWGACTMDHLAPIQLVINKICQALIDNGLWLAHGIWVADSNSGVSAKSLGAYGPRDVVVKNPGSDVHRDSGVPLPPHIFELLQQQVDAFDHVAGLPDVLRGIVPSRQPVATVAQQQESGEVRTRERARRVTEGLEALGEGLFELVRNHWADSRTISVQKANGGFKAFELTKKDFEGWRGKVRIQPGSTLPMDRASALSRASDLRQNLGIAIPDGFFVQLADIPGLEQAMNEQQKAAQAPGAEPTDVVPGDPLQALPLEGDGAAQLPSAPPAMPQAAPMPPIGPPIGSPMGLGAGGGPLLP